MKIILYIHGMGGGKDSFTPKILQDKLPCYQIVCRTYDFNPDSALPQIKAWTEELQPSLIISESMGANYGILCSQNLPHIYLSPAFGAPLWLGFASYLCLIPGVSQLLGKLFKPFPEGERQSLDFSYSCCKQFIGLRKKVIHNLKRLKSLDSEHYAYFGAHDPYLRSGVVNIRRAKKFFNTKNCHIDQMRHFWTEERIISARLCEKIHSLLD